MKRRLFCFLGITTLVTALTGTTHTQAGTPFEKAEWLRDPVFAGTKPLELFTLQKTKQKGTPLRNVHTYFRKEIDLPNKPVKAVLHITADDYFKFYINGRFVVQGPAQGYPFAYPYCTLEVTKFLKKGRNALAAHTYYHGVAARSFTSADNRSGFILRLELTFPDGTTQVCTTDKTWKCLHVKAFQSSHMFGYGTQFNENIDMRLIPVGWRKVGFNDSSWSPPLVERQDHHFVPQITPPLEHWRARPVVAKKKADGHYFFDFGGEIVGHTRIKIRGHAGDVITVWHGEELAGPETVRHQMRCNCNYEDKITLSGRTDLIEFYDYRGFRYIEILNAPSPPEVWVDVRHHPFNPAASRFHSSDELLNRIWEMCKRGVQMGCQETVVDCPTREKGQYTGDTYMVLLSQLLLTADPTLAKKAIKDFQLSQHFDEGMLAVAPGGYRQGLAEWSLLWPAMLKYYYQMTGDKDFVREMIEAKAFDKLLGYFAQMESENGLLTGVDKKKWVLIDWPANLRGGYDYERTKNGENTVVNAYYYRALRDCAALMRAVGYDGSVYETKAERLRRSFTRRLLDPQTGLFRDGADSQHCSLHANCLSLYCGLVPEENVDNVIELLRRKRLDCGLFTAGFIIEGCYRAGDGELAYELITSRDKHSWYEMLKAGATTPLEAWAPELKWNTSWCHPAGSMPIYLITRYLLGLEPAEPGWKAVRVCPQIPKKLDNIELTFPIPTGSVTAKYDRSSGYQLTVPAGTRVVVAAPERLPVKVFYAK